MDRTATLKSLSGLLEDFLRRAVALKEDRLRVLGGINDLDNIARAAAGEGTDVTDSMGTWLADHRNWLTDNVLRQSDANRIAAILQNISGQLSFESATPARDKVQQEIGRFGNKTAPSSKLVLKRGPEETAPGTTVDDSIERFGQTMESVLYLFHQLSLESRHLLSLLDQSLLSSTLRKDKQALLLSATIIYYLKQEGYLVEPYIKRLRKAQQAIREAGAVC
ncbi:MAG: hypothetical protein ACE5FH_06135 [Candidatus Zixiibacteriota bacterium]